MKVYIIGIGAVDGFNRKCVCASKSTAIKRFEELRSEILRDLDRRILYSRETETDMERWIEELQRRRNAISNPDAEVMRSLLRLSDDEPMMIEVEVEE